MKVSMVDVVQNQSPKAYIGGNNAVLSHDGDFVTILCPPTLGSIDIRAQVKTRAHWVNGLTGQSSNSGSHTSEVEKKLTAGETWEISNHEQGWSSSDEAKEAADAGAKRPSPNSAIYVDDQNVFIFLDGATNPDGTPGEVDKTTTYSYYWHIFDTKDVELSSGECLSLDAGKAAIKQYGDTQKLAYYKWTVTDYVGKVIGSGSHSPSPTDMSWLWWVLGIAAVGIFAAIVWRYFIAGKVIGGVQMPGPFIKGKMGQAPGAAAVTPAAPAPAPVVVVNK